MAKTTITLTAEDRTTAAFNSVRKNFQSLENGMDQVKNIASGLTSALGAVGIGLSVNYFKGLIEHSIDALDHLNDLSKTTRLSVEVLSGLQLAAQQTGSDLDGTAAAINKLAVNMGKHAEAFADLGITAKDPLEAFKQLADILNAIEDPQQRAAVAATALGKSWQASAALMAEGGSRMDEMIAKGMRLSKVTHQTTEAADNFKDRLAELKAASEGATVSMVTIMLPGLVQIATKMSEAAQSGSVLWGVIRGVMEASKVLFYGVDDTKIQRQTKYLAEMSKELQFLEHNLELRNKAKSWQLWQYESVEEYTQKIASLKLGIEQATRGLKNMQEQAQKMQEQLKQLPPTIPGLDDKTNKFLKKKGEFEKQSFEDFGGGQFIKTGIGGGGVNSPEQSAFDIAKSYGRAQVEIAQDVEDEKLQIAADGMTKQEAMEKQRAEDSRKVWENFVENVQRTLGSQLYEVMQGNFKNIGTAFAQMLEHMVADALAANLMKALFAGGSGWIGLLGASGGGQTGAAAAAVAFGAKGAWFDGPTSHFATGGVVGSPTMFRFGGGLGMMGEAGPEAIMPLRRDASGRLGVSGGGTTVTYAPLIQIDSRTDRTEVRQLVFGAVERGNADLVEKLSRAGTI